MRKPAADVMAYARYASWCQSIGVPPAEPENWERETRKISSTHNDMRIFQPTARIKMDPINAQIPRG